ncbi:PREDICTED: uncharacterized protein LOC104595952 [Nelumbo nucifera]|uniref:Uncharacterized protein LOC104595952 n=1 Tax=Nelumbo nucifera TaxID=4432 RepID=A0A1U7ZPC5_NELNU|nr:PREDICTED: uncharacterized protein LOC104595952 [Nelumbo nucifera]
MAISKSLLDKLFGRLFKLKILIICYSFLKFLAVGDVPVKLTNTLDCLKYISLTINLDDSKQILAALCLFRSSPHLQEIEVTADSDKASALIHQANFWEANQLPLREIIFRRLRKMKLIEFKGVAHEMGFIQFVLENATVLDKLSIKRGKGFQFKELEQLPVLKKMIQFRRASSNAKVIFLD